MRDKLALRPFHETIVGAIKRCPSPSTGEILRLHQLIMETRIPAGHDAILSALAKFWDFPGASKWSCLIREVVESVEAQKSLVDDKPSNPYNDATAVADEDSDAY